MSWNAQHPCPSDGEYPLSRFLCPAHRFRSVTEISKKGTKSAKSRLTYDISPQDVLHAYARRCVTRRALCGATVQFQASHAQCVLRRRFLLNDAICGWIMLAPFLPVPELVPNLVFESTAKTGHNTPDATQQQQGMLLTQFASKRKYNARG